MNDIFNWKWVCNPVADKKLLAEIIGNDYTNTTLQ